MNTALIIGAMGAAAVILGGILIAALRKSAEQAGAKAEQVREMQKADEAKERANEVLAEHRDPDDATKRLRDGTF